MSSARATLQVVPVPGRARMATVVLALGALHLLVWVPFWFRFPSGQAATVPAAVFVAFYFLVAWRIAGRRAVLGPDSMAIVGMWHARIPREDLRGVILDRRPGLRGAARAIIGLDETGLGRTLWRGVYWAREDELQAFAHVLNAWCGAGVSQPHVEPDNVARMRQAALNLEQAGRAQSLRTMDDTGAHRGNGGPDPLHVEGGQG